MHEQEPVKRCGHPKCYAMSIIKEQRSLMIVNMKLSSRSAQVVPPDVYVLEVHVYSKNVLEELDY